MSRSFISNLSLSLTLGVADGSEKGGQEGGRRADSATLGRVGDTGRAQAQKEGGYWGGWWAVGGEWQVASGKWTRLSLQADA